MLDSQSWYQYFEAPEKKSLYWLLSSGKGIEKKKSYCH